MTIWNPVWNEFLKKFRWTENLLIVECIFLFFKCKAIVLSSCDIKHRVIHWEHYLYPLLKWQLIVDDKGMACVSRILYLHMKETCKRMLTINAWPRCYWCIQIILFGFVVCAMAFLTRSRKIIYHFSGFYDNFSFTFFSIFSITFQSLSFLSQES